MTRSVLRPAPGRLIGERIIIRPYRDEDAEALHGAIAESVDHLRPWFAWYDKHRSVADTLAYIRQTQAEYVLRQAFEMGIFSSAGRLLGGCALHARDWDVPSFMIGYWIRYLEEGKGYITEAARLLTQVAFGELGAERVYLFCDSENARSRRVAERAGFVFEGRGRHVRRNTAGRLADVLYFSILREEYEAGK